MNTLYLSLKSTWYELIESLIKPEEYRGITAHWITRLLEYSDGEKIMEGVAIYFQQHQEILKFRIEEGVIVFKKFEKVRFSYGYTSRRMSFKIGGMTIGRGNPEWGAPKDEDVFIINLEEKL